MKAWAHANSNWSFRKITRNLRTLQNHVIAVTFSEQNAPIGHVTHIDGQEVRLTRNIIQSD